LNGSWYACHIVHEDTNNTTNTTDTTTVAMGRPIGDGGWYFHIADMAVLPTHQRHELGDAILRALLERVRSEAPEGPYVSLFADEPGRRLYERYGFRETAPKSLGMVVIL
jgi:ribosomal protein S18 acetylase RimI-like enzyme